ncbi:hypothetical protein KM043_015577 [Ampulex compressa]|nr:hypothetical protein KM043_015577 [Ampulex compressa]
MRQELGIQFLILNSFPSEETASFFLTSLRRTVSTYSSVSAAYKVLKIGILQLGERPLRWELLEKVTAARGVCFQMKITRHRSTF